MPGFRVNNQKYRGELKNYANERCVSSFIEIGDICVERNTLDKFLKDKIWVKKDNLFIQLEGVVFNFQELTTNCKCTSYTDTALSLYENYGIEFLKLIDGEVSGTIVDVSNNVAYIFTSGLGSKAVFYYATNGCFVAGSQLNYITDFMRETNIPREIDSVALRQFMGYGYYLDDSTALLEVKRLYPGHYLRVDLENYSIEDTTYYIADYEQNLHISKDEAIQRMHDTFCKAIEKILKKNEEYSYKTLLDISAGGDSRMICCAANEIGARNVLMDCYAQSGSKDAKTAQHIANMLQYDFVFRSLDNASCLMHIDDNIMMNNGATVYYGITGGKDMLETLDRDVFGMECTGLLGDIYDGSMVVTYSDGTIDKNYMRFRISHTLEYDADFTFPKKMEAVFKNHVNEHFWFYTRGMIFGMTSYFIRQNFTEVATPFGDRDFLQVYLSLPWNERVNGHLLRHWLEKYYPSAAAVEYDNTGISLSESCTKWGKSKATIIRYKRKLLSYISKEKPSGMNDYTYWYNHNHVFKSVIDEYYEENIKYADIDETIKKLIERLFNGIVRDKLLAVSVLSIIKQYIVE